MSAPTHRTFAPQHDTASRRAADLQKAKHVANAVGYHVQIGADYTARIPIGLLPARRIATDQSRGTPYASNPLNAGADRSKGLPATTLSPKPINVHTPTTARGPSVLSAGASRQIVSRRG